MAASLKGHARGGYTSTTCYIEKYQDELLRQLSFKTKIPIAEYIRQGIEAILEKHKDKLQPEEEDGVSNMGR